ncbi:MAG: 50S ribosomal protein L9 [Flavobacteriaceae bacterium]|nr:50S ribosomal protein L9 [Flavobacteriaceae bacterium]
MNVILQEDLENLGFEFEIVSVKPGYARNFLIPQGKAKEATTKNLAELNQIMESRREQEETAIASAKEIIAAMEGLTIELPAKVGEGDRLFGSVNNADLTDFLNKNGVNVERKHVQILGRNIKRLGHYHAVLKPHREIQHEFTFDVIAE